MKSSIAMNPQERNASMILAWIYALRMLGIFLLLPVFSLYATQLSGGENKMWVGLAFGIYGLTQAMLQLPLGMASDRFGRKKIIYIGLIVFALGSFLAAFANDIVMLTIARAIQGAGAVSAVVVALLADLTRPDVRIRAMSMIGMSIALSFSFSLMIGPTLEHYLGVSGIFMLTGVLVLSCIAIVYWFLPNPQQTVQNIHWHEFKDVFGQRNLWHLHFGIFAVHCAQMALFMVLPFILRDLMPSEQWWQLYLPATIIGIILMVPAVLMAEVRHHMKGVLLSAIFLLVIVQFLLGYTGKILWQLYGWLSLYFLGLNTVEAILPSWVSKIANPKLKGTAMGIYNTAMSLGLFSGSLIGGWLLQYFGTQAVFYFCSGLMLCWFLLVLPTAKPKIFQQAS